jgi:uncharacterized membrane protein YkvA (DUF1232 family)
MGLRTWARSLRRDAHALWLAGRDPRTPWYAKALAVGVAAYAFSPIDLIPDIIPIVGYLDDLILVPIGIWVCLQLVPPEILAEHRAAADRIVHKPVSKSAAVIVIGLWLLVTAVVGLIFLGR